MKYIYTLYVWIVGLILLGVLALLSILVLQWITPKTFSPVFKGWIRFLLNMLFIRVKVSGTEHLSKNQPCIIMANHVSFMDVAILGAYTPFHTIGIEDKSHFTWPIFGTLIKKHGNIPIDRKNSIRSKKTYKLAEQKLHEGTHLVIFPEGGRTSDGRLMPFKNLPFQLAHSVGCAIVPLGMIGVYEMNNKNSFLVHPVKIHLKFGPPIPGEIVSTLSVKELRLLTYQKISDLLEVKYYP